MLRTTEFSEFDILLKGGCIFLYEQEVYSSELFESEEEIIIYLN